MLAALKRSFHAPKRSHIFQHTRSLSNYFAYFPNTIPNGPPPQGSFDIDLKRLRAEYISAQRKSHPDVAGPNNQINSAELGVAYKILQDPVSRGEHILALQNANPLQEGAATLENEDLLMEIMMTREQVSEAESQVELDSVIAKNDKLWDEAVKEMGAALEQGNTALAQSKLVELTYWTKIKRAIEDKLEEIGA